MWFDWNVGCWIEIPLKLNKQLDLLDGLIDAAVIYLK